jgi:hypothetical protein
MPELCLFVDAVRGKNLSLDGDQFGYALTPALQLPFDATPTLRVLEADIWYTTPNVSAVHGNNSLRFAQVTSGTVEGGTASLDMHTITFEDGLYSLEDLRAEISSYCMSSLLHDSALDVVGHSPTQKCEFKWDVQGTGYGIVLYLGDANSIGSLLGFAATDLVYDAFCADKTDEVARFRSGASANFDSLSHFLLHVSCLSGSNYDSSGSASTQVACAITPDVSPGNLIKYRPLHPIPTGCEGLRGNRTSNLTFAVTDNLGYAVVLRESWSARILISW